MTDRIEIETHRLGLELSEAQYYADVDRQIDLQEKLKRIKDDPKQYFKDDFNDWYNNLDSHDETIQCPECNYIQIAKVIDTAPFSMHVHQCINCAFLIGESEWNKINNSEIVKK